MYGKAEPVAPEPKVFAGQIPFESTTQDVHNLFAQYGNIRSCQVITGPDGRSKGCAMILYECWAEAELAVENENGTVHLGGTKPMVVKFADPPKRGDGPIVGIASRKLFVGQLPLNFTEEALRALFAPYGNITEMHLLKKGMGSGCAFVSFERWAQCEAAIAGLNGKTQLEGAKMPLVVKFADAKIEQPQMGMMMGGMGATGTKRAFATMDPAMMMGGAAGPQGKKMFTGMGGQPGFNPYNMPFNMGMGMGMGMGYGPMMGMGMGGMGNMGMGMGGMGGGHKATGNSHMQASKMGAGMTDENAKQWKLFVGQVPFEANEADLWPLFAQIGNVLELVVLRTPQGKSKGCAFVTFENRMMAEKAIRQLDGQVCVPNDPKQRLLIVKYASQGSAAAAPGSAAAQMQSGGDMQAAYGGMGMAATDASGMTGAGLQMDYQQMQMQQMNQMQGQMQQMNQMAGMQGMQGMQPGAMGMQGMQPGAMGMQPGFGQQQMGGMGMGF